MNHQRHTSSIAAGASGSGLGFLRAPILATALLASALMAGAAPARAQSIAPIDINTATADQLASQIRGVGIKRAEAIVAYRASHGPFASVDELVLVTGVGQNTVDTNRKHLTVGEHQAVTQSN